jgi:protease I
MDIAGKTVAILATDGFEQSELLVPLRRLKEVGARVDIVSPKDGEIRGWNGDDWGGKVEVDVRLSEADPDNYDALMLPGGQINPDLLRVNDEALKFIRAFQEASKPIGAICHAPWLLIEADIASGLRGTSYHSIKKDMINAGADWVDEPAVVDRNIVTSRKPEDLDAFCTSLVDLISRSPAPHSQASAATR